MVFATFRKNVTKKREQKTMENDNTETLCCCRIPHKTQGFQAFDQNPPKNKRHIVVVAAFVVVAVLLVLLLVLVLLLGGTPCS